MKSKIKSAMLKQNISVYRLSKETKIPQTTLRDYIAIPERDMRSENVIKVIKYLKIEIK